VQRAASLQGPSPTIGVHRHTSYGSLRTKRVKRTTSSLTQDSSHSTGQSSLEIYIRKVQPSQDHDPQDRQASQTWDTFPIPHPRISVADPQKTRIRQPSWRQPHHRLAGIVEKENAPPPSAADAVEPGLYYQVKIISLNRRYSMPQGFISPFQVHSLAEIIPANLSQRTSPKNIPKSALVTLIPSPSGSFLPINLQ
jgi:hypothetical protein